MPITAYCVQAITQQLSKNELLEEARIAIPLTTSKPTDTRLKDLRVR